MHRTGRINFFLQKSIFPVFYKLDRSANSIPLLLNYYLISRTVK